jgi:hypothetical protein
MFFLLYQYKIIVEQEFVQKFGANNELNALSTCSGFQALSSDMPAHVIATIWLKPHRLSPVCK